MLVNSNPELTLSQNLSEPLHKSRASSNGSDAHFAQSGEEKKQIYTLYPLHPLKAPFLCGDSDYFRDSVWL